MPRKSTTGGITPKGNRIELCFVYQGKRYRPTIPLRPTPANLRRARQINDDIKARIERGTFDFSEEFPTYKRLSKVPSLRLPQNPTFAKVVDEFMETQGEQALITQRGYQNILDSFWKPLLGDRPIKEIKYSELAKIVSNTAWGSTKTRNNKVSILRRVFAFAHADEIIDRDPTERLKSLKVQARPHDPYTIHDAELLIAGIRENFGSQAADYVEWQFFTGCRPSETIALTWDHVDFVSRTVRIERARVAGFDKNRTKTGTARDIDLCPRAFACLMRQKPISFDRIPEVFTKADGFRWSDIQIQWKQWRHAHKRLGLRYREPYQARHSSVTWHLLIGSNPLWVAAQHGHSTSVMFKNYAKWLRGTTKADIEAIRQAMGDCHLNPTSPTSANDNHFDSKRDSLAEREGFEP